MAEKDSPKPLAASQIELGCWYDISDHVDAMQAYRRMEGQWTFRTSYGACWYVSEEDLHRYTIRELNSPFR